MCNSYFILFLPRAESEQLFLIEKAIVRATRYGLSNSTKIFICNIELLIYKNMYDREGEKVVVGFFLSVSCKFSLLLHHFAQVLAIY